jgi:macrolide-specific efflux system membrane fusion protein
MKTVVRRARIHPWITSLAAVAVVAAVTCGVYFGTRGTSASAATVSTRLQTITTGTVKQTVSATGTVVPAEQANLNFLVSGQVTKVAATVGQSVTKGQALATINSASLAASEAQAQSSVANAQAKVSNDSTSTTATSTQINADNAALAAAQNQLASAQSQLAQATLTAPFDGVVASVNLTLGQSVSASSSSSSSSASASGSSGASGGGGGAGGGSGAAAGGSSASSSTSSTPQILVINTNSWIVNASVDASSVGLIQTNDQAQMTVTGATATVYGTVSTIGLVSSTTTGTASYPVVIAVTGTPAGLHDGANATASVIYKQVTGLVVPTTALHRNATGGQYVNQVKNGQTVPTIVQVGISAAGQTQITSGLSDGDQIQVPQVQAPAGGTRTGGTGGTGGQFPGGGRFPGGGGGAGGAGGGAVGG